MKKIILFTFGLFFYLNIYSQTFVKDVEKVEVVVLKYCVDEEGKRFNIEIDSTRSSYKHNGWQLSVLDHFKKSKLIVPMKMVNQCWDAVYYFVNEKYKTKTLPISKRSSCKMFHKGVFKYHNLAYNDVKIKRRKKMQIEKSKDQRQVYKINWIEDHIYTLETIKLPLEKDKHKIGNLINVEIIEVFGNSYLYKSNIKGEEKYIYGIIHKEK